MKKLLSLLATATLVASTTMPIIACGTDPENPDGDATDSLPDKNFELESNSITIDTVNAGFIKITNWSILNENSKPTKFTYDKEGIVQLTVTNDGKITVSPLSKAQDSIVEVKIESKVHSQSVKVTVKEIAEETEFKLEKTSIEMVNNATTEIKILNWDALKEENKPSILTVNEEYATAQLDAPNKKIIVKSKNEATEGTDLIIESESGFKVTVKLKIYIKSFDLTQSNLVKNLAAGNMVNGLIDSTIAPGKDGFGITDESVISSFNTMNNINLSSTDLEVIRDGDGTSAGNNGKGAAYILKAKDGSKNVNGEVLLTFNQNIDPLQYFAVKNLGEIKLFSGAYNRLDEVLVSKDMISLSALIFEQVGVKNPQLEYYKANFIDNMGAAGQAIMKNAITNATTFQITEMPDLGGIFKAGTNVQFTFKFVEEDRITLTEGMPENGKVSVDVTNLVDKSKNGQKAAKTEIYHQLNDTFKKNVTLNNFIDFTNIIFGTKSDDGHDIDFKFDVLPGSEKLYGHDGAAWQGYICASPIAGSATGGGNLNKYEDSGKLDTKYSDGMGYFSLEGSISGNFYQGHDIMTLKQSITQKISDFTMKDNEEKTMEFGINNMPEGAVVEVESLDTNFVNVVSIEKKDETYTLVLKATWKKSGLFPPYPKNSSTVKIKVNGYVSQAFNVKVNEK